MSSLGNPPCGSSLPLIPTGASRIPHTDGHGVRRAAAQWFVKLVQRNAGTTVPRNTLTIPGFR